MNAQVEQVIKANTEMVGATPEMVKFYQTQPLGLLADKPARRIINRAYANMKDRPDRTTVLWIVGEGGGVGKTTRASRVLAEVGFNPKFIERFIDDSGYVPEARYVAMTTVGQDLQKEFDADGNEIVDKTAPNWTADHINVIRTRLEETVALAATTRFQEMGRAKSQDPDHKVATLLVVEDLTKFQGNRLLPITRDHFGLWVLSNSQGQDNASEQRRSNEDPDAELGDIYRSNGGVLMDKPTLRGTDAEDFMGNDGSRKRAFDGLNTDVLNSEEFRQYAQAQGIRNFNLYDLANDLRFRNYVVLRAFYEKRTQEELDFERGNVAVVENLYTPGLPYNLELIRQLKVNTSEVHSWMPK